MSLPDAVLAIAESMEADATADADVHSFRTLLRSFARELRTAVKASAGSAQSFVGMMTNPEAAMFSHRAGIEAAKPEFRKDKPGQPTRREAGDIEEEYDGRYVEVRGGPADRSTSPISPKMPVGAKTFIAGVVYVLRRADEGVWLEYSEEETQKAKEAKS